MILLIFRNGYSLCIMWRNFRSEKCCAVNTNNMYTIVVLFLLHWFTFYVFLGLKLVILIPSLEICFRVLFSTKNRRIYPYVLTMTVIIRNAMT